MAQKVVNRLIEIKISYVFIKKIVCEVMGKYVAGHGKKGISRKDVINIIIGYGGDMEDVRASMIEVVMILFPEQQQN